mmetsp:Transcript_45835/g.111774  ORF Transcript_45835/g.111774 Transcript_45835/m.111774 type:complete len:243 (-) Transcript_45835:352-1080(-)
MTSIPNVRYSVSIVPTLFTIVFNRPSFLSNNAFPMMYLYGSNSSRRFKCAICPICSIDDGISQFVGNSRLRTSSADQSSYDNEIVCVVQPTMLRIGPDREVEFKFEFESYAGPDSLSINNDWTEERIFSSSFTFVWLLSESVSVSGSTGYFRTIFRKSAAAVGVATSSATFATAFDNSVSVTSKTTRNLGRCFIMTPLLFKRFKILCVCCLDTMIAWHRKVTSKFSRDGNDDMGNTNDEEED